MDELNKSYEAISANESLSEALKENFKQLITVFHQTFNEVDLTNFNERIKRLKIKKGNKYITKDSCEYNPKENVIYLNESKLQDADAKHELMFTILTIISAKDNFYGFDTNGRLKSLNVGITEMLTNFLVGNECDDNE
jgi:hypothetical protein